MQKITRACGSTVRQRTPFTEAVSMIVNCETQSEVDHYWGKLSAGGQTQQCGWLKDKFGVSWQIVPTALVEPICDKDLAKSQRVMQAMLQMTKSTSPDCESRVRHESSRIAALLMRKENRDDQLCRCFCGPRPRE